jgi:hypothetical protein
MEEKEMLNKNKPFQVTAPEGKTRLVIMNASDGLPAAFALMGTRAKEKKAIRLAGGCKGMSAEDKEQMLDFFSAGLSGYGGLIWAGGTRQVDKNGEIDPMITDVPGYIAKQNDGCIAMGTVPRTAMLSLQGESRLVLDEWGTALNPEMYGILIVQNGPDGEMGWDGDVETYFKLMRNWRDYAGFSELGLIAWNGGLVTADEIKKAAKQGWPTLLVEGSGRATDEIIEKYRNRDADLMAELPEDPNIIIISKNDPEKLREVLLHTGFIAAA